MISVHLYLLLSHILTVSLPPSACSNPLRRHPPLPPRRSPLVLRLFALALADGSGLPFSLYPPLAALESQTPQREPRALSRRCTESAKVRTAVKPAGRAALIRHGAAQKRRAMPPSPRGRLRRRSKAKPVRGFLFMRSALTVGIKSKSPPCSNEHGGLFLSTERAQNQYFIITATQPPCSRRFSVVKPASRQAFSTSSARVSIIPEIINVPPLSR